MKPLEAIRSKQGVHAGWWREIHAHPELAYKETRTAAFVCGKLDDFGLPLARGIGGTGVVATLCNGSSGRSVGLRADMDALSLQELNTFDHRSRHDGVMHACGHDGHTTMLLAAAEYLAANRVFDGTVHFIFQPAEEGEAGARAMIDDGLFDRFAMDAVYGLHNWPGLAVGKMATRVGPVMAAMDVFEVTVLGKGGHAALPHLAVDPILAAAQLIQAWQGIVSRNVNPLDAAVLSVTQFHAGNAWAVIPNEVVLRGTVRAFTHEVRRMVRDRMQQTASAICAGHGCELQWWYEHRFPPTVNSTQETDLAAAAAAALLGSANVDTQFGPSTGSDDFGYMLEQKPGCYAVIGNGPGAGNCLLHSPLFDFNDDIIPIGAAYWVALVEHVLRV